LGDGKTRGNRLAEGLTGREVGARVWVRCIPRTLRRRHVRLPLVSIVVLCFVFLGFLVFLGGL
jgi:hypothetical protein